jgi:hypothetical protein
MTFFERFPLGSRQGGASAARVARSGLPAIWSLAVIVSALGCGAVQAGAQSGERFEISTLKTVRIPLSKALAALQTRDFTGAKAAFADFDTGWKGIEMYILTRDKSAYEVENNLRLKIINDLNGAKPDANVLNADTQALLAKYDASIGLAEKAAPLNTLYDDVARLRMFRADLREVDIAIRASDFAKARKSLTVFNGKLDTVSSILKARSPEALDAVKTGIAQLQAGLKAPTPDAAKSMAVIRGITAKYNMVLNQVTSEARIRLQSAKQ